MLPYAAPKVDSKAAAGTTRLGEYFRGPASSHFGVRAMSWLLLRAGEEQQAITTLLRPP